MDHHYHARPGRLRPPLASHASIARPPPAPMGNATGSPGRSRVAPPPWWLTREPTRWDQCRMHLTCAALHAREVARELWRALYARAHARTAGHAAGGPE